MPAIAPTTPVAKDSGFVIPTFETGAVLVQDDHGRTTRLSWEDPAQKNRRRSLVPGKYIVRGYRLYRKDKSGRDWIVSATGPRIKQFAVEPGKELKLAIDETVHFASGMKPGAGKVDVMMSFSGEGHSGLTVYADGKRIPVRYLLLSPSGEEIAKGPMNYG